MPDTTALTVADELRTAAVLLRETASAAPAGPWSLDGPRWWPGEPPECTSVITTHADRLSVVVVDKPGPVRHPKADKAGDWIALMDPDVAKHLAAGFEQVADEAETHEAAGWGNSADEIAEGWLLDLARSLNRRARSGPGASCAAPSSPVAS
ncbi:hypothetical protein [Nonomuraea sp. NPDC050310]|uniref:hypothetical protein n=1 Tax=Nonomuraea sp. NPDC050310 TaxID=3154935 RepID=UPI0033D48517